MDKLQWFKFSYADWRMGKIQKCPEVTQARFMNLCCLYWSKESNLSYEDAEIEIEKEHLDILLSKKIIEQNDEFIIIKFLDEQLEGIAETSKGKSKAAKARWDKYREDKESKEQKSTDAMHVHTDAMQNNAEKSRGEEIREEKRREESKKAKAFDLFWSKYPKKVAKDKCKIKFIKLSKDDINKIIKTIDGFITYKPFDTYTHPNPMTYLNQSRWNDEKEVKVIERTKQEIYEEELAKVLKDKYK
jgi:ATPase subunit of ABC transporter with duplicated ATPase domains